jgi:hypothetical protein
MEIGQEMRAEAGSLVLVKVEAFNQVCGCLVEDLDPHEVCSPMRFLAVSQSMN